MMMTHAANEKKYGNEVANIIPWYHENYSGENSDNGRGQSNINHDFSSISGDGGGSGVKRNRNMKIFPSQAMPVSAADYAQG